MASFSSTSISRARPGDYGQRWGEGAARCFCIESDFDEDESVRLLPIPECFICPMSQTPMEDPVMTVDGCVYERSYIEQWMRHRQQQRLPVTSPATNQELPSHRLVSLTALKKAIEAYLAHRPELLGSLTASRSFEEAAQMLQSDLLEKQAAHVSAEDELSLLRDSNEVLSGALHEAERSYATVRREHEQATERARLLEEAVRERESSCGALRVRLQLLEERCRVMAARLQELDRPEAAPRPEEGPPRAAEEACHREDRPCSEAAQPHAQGSRGSARRASVRPVKGTATRPASPWGFTAVHLCVLCGFLLVAVSLIVVLVSAEGGVLSSALSDASAVLQELRPPPPAAPPAAAPLPVARAQQASTPAAVVETTARRREELRPPPAPAVHVAAASGPGAPALQASGPAATAVEPTPRRREDKRDDAFSEGARIDEGLLQDLSEQELQDLNKQVALLRQGSPDQRTNSALVLGILATASPGNQAAIVRAGAVFQLVELLKGDVPEARGQAAVALKALAANNTYNKVAIVRAGAIAPLIRLLKEDTVEVQEVAEGALLTLAETDSQADCRGSLERLDELAFQAAAALVDLAAEDADDLAAIARAGALSVLADLLKDDLPGVREEALAALRNLAGSQPEDELALLHMAAAAGLAMKAAAGAPTSVE